MRGMRRDVGASLSGPCNPTSCKSPAMSRRQSTNTEQQQQHNQHNTVDLTWFGVRPTSTGDQWRVFLLEKEGEDYTLKTSLLSLQEKKKYLKMQLKNWRPEI